MIWALLPCQSVFLPINLDRYYLPLLLLGYPLVGLTVFLDALRRLRQRKNRVEPGVLPGGGGRGVPERGRPVRRSPRPPDAGRRDRARKPQCNAGSLIAPRRGAAGYVSRL